MTDQQTPAPGKKNLTNVLGGGSVAAAAAAMLITMIASEESGRKVETTVTPEGAVTVRHVTGPQYLRAYRDSVGVLTICDGLTRGVRPGEVRTEAQCARELESELTATAAKVMACVPNLKGHPNQQVAAVSLAYNIGTGGFCGSKAAAHFRAGRWRQGCDAMLSWNKGTFSRPQPGKVCARKADGRYLCPIGGLTRRRERERAICVQGL